jgi:predicted nucleic acid-binding protein
LKVLVDTSVWSAVLRRRPRRALSAPQRAAVDELAMLIEEARANMAGCIRQEVLSGVASEAQFQKLRKKLRAFDDLAANAATYELAASFFNRCRAKGVQGSHIDFLICALSREHGAPILTLDADFARYAPVCNIELHQAR